MYYLVNKPSPHRRRSSPVYHLYKDGDTVCHRWKNGTIKAHHGGTFKLQTQTPRDLTLCALCAEIEARYHPSPNPFPPGRGEDKQPATNKQTGD